MKVMARSALKKIEVAGGKEGVAASATPAKTKIPAKRGHNEQDADDNEDGATPAKRKRCLKPKTPEKEVADGMLRVVYGLDRTKLTMTQMTTTRRSRRPR